MPTPPFRAGNAAAIGPQFLRDRFNHCFAPGAAGADAQALDPRTPGARTAGAADVLRIVLLAAAFADRAALSSAPPSSLHLADFVAPARAAFPHGIPDTLVWPPNQQPPAQQQGADGQQPQQPHAAWQIAPPPAQYQQQGAGGQPQQPNQPQQPQLYSFTFTVRPLHTRKSSLKPNMLLVPITGSRRRRK